MRRRHEIARARQLQISDVADPAVLAMIHRLPSGELQVTALNFGPRTLTTTINSAHLEPFSTITDVASGTEIAALGADPGLALQIGGYAGRCLIARAVGSA